MRNRTQYLTVLQFDLCGVQGDKLDHYRKGAVPEQQMFPISYVKGCKNIQQYHGCVYATTNPWIYLAAASRADFMCSSD